MQMEIDIKETFKKVKEMGMGCYSMRMGIGIRENGKKIFSMGMES